MSIKIVRLPRDKMPAPAFTDSNTVFICREAKADEFKVLYKHEVCHIFLEHHSRHPRDMKHLAEWQQATELEIARNIYDEDDIEMIKRPFSVLYGGILPDSIKDLPEDLKTAEEIYDWLLKNPDKKLGNHKKCCMTSEKESDDKKKEGECQECDCQEHEHKDNKGEKKKSKEEIEEMIKNLKETINNQNEVNYPIKTIKTYKKPTLASEIDYILRSKNLRKRTYARESRVKSEGFLLRGRQVIKRSPKIEVFVDRSGSFQGHRTAKSLEVIKTIMKKYNVKVKTDFFYFSNGKLYDHDVPAQGGNPYPLVMKHLEESRPKIAIILTDNDQEGDLKPLSHKNTTIYCVPIGVDHTSIAKQIKAKDIAL